jgi:ribA/ribD-fused uncharacterized protein
MRYDLKPVLSRALALLNFVVEDSDQNGIPEKLKADLHQLGGFMQSELDTANNAELDPNYHKLDTPNEVFFYEQDFYILSNFSAFRVKWGDQSFDTLEHAYHFRKFEGVNNTMAQLARQAILNASSAHEAFQIAQSFKNHRRTDWDVVKESIMQELMEAKVKQHMYVREKLLKTGTRRLVEDSWRDSYWGTGADGKGKNRCGALWEIVRGRAERNEI